MPVSISRNFGPLTDVATLTREEWGRVGRLARERIIARTLSGRDEHDQSFTAYSPAYARRRAAEGMPTTPNLQVSGEMLRAITVEPDDTGVTLAFTS